MKTIGFIGGLSWESTAEYYRYVNEAVQKKCGKLHSAKCMIHSFDFQEMVELQHSGKWQEATERMIDAAKKLETAGAACIVICTNTMHLMAEQIEERLTIPLLHIVDATAKIVREKKLEKVAILGTKFTMEEGFYHERLAEHGLESIIPAEQDRQAIHDIIYNELCIGIVTQQSKRTFLEIISRLNDRGAEGIILGCTEIPLLLTQKDVKLPLFNTTKIHANAAVEFSLSDTSIS